MNVSRILLKGENRYPWQNVKIGFVKLNYFRSSAFEIPSVERIIKLPSANYSLSLVFEWICHENKKNCNCWIAALKLIILDGYQDLSNTKQKATRSDSLVCVSCILTLPDWQKKHIIYRFTCFCHLKIITKRCMVKGLWIKAMAFQLFLLSAKWTKAWLVWGAAVPWERPASDHSLITNILFSFL